MGKGLEEEIAELRARVAELEREAESAKEADAQLALYRVAVGNAPVGLAITDAEGDILLWNDAWLAASGFAHYEETEWHKVRATPAARESRKRTLEVIRKEGAIFERPTTIPRRDGGANIEVLLTAVPFHLDGREYLHVMMDDVTEHRAVEDALRESELRFRQFAEKIRHVFYMLSADGRETIYVSPAFEELWQHPCTALYANPQIWLDSIHPEDRGRITDEIARGPRNQEWSFEYRMVRPDGTVRWIADKSYALVNEKGETYRIVGLAVDVTDQRRLEERLREAQKMDAIGQLAGGVAHDFNNLLTTIVANVGLVLKQLGPSDPHRESLEDVKVAVNRAAELTKKLIGFSRRAVLRLEPLDLRDTVRETAALLRRTLDPAMRVAIDEPATLGTVLADGGEMGQVLLNLCLNGRDAMPHGGTLRIETREHTVTEEHAQRVLDAHPGEAICLTVEDTGTGIASGARGRIFEPFFTTKEPGAGTGLGLAMVFGIVKQHRGWIEFSTEIGRGTRFDVYLPKHGEPRVQRIAPVPPVSRPPTRETILFVDDEPSLRKVAQAILSDRGYRVILAEDGVAALSILEREPLAIDLVVLDLRMPRLSGQETLREIWRVRPDARVLVSSGHAAEHQQIAEREPIAGSLRKPYGFDELVTAVRAALDGEKRTLSVPPPMP